MSRLRLFTRSSCKTRKASNFRNEMNYFVFTIRVKYYPDGDVRHAA